jgi:undecaprenyl diphosphate synthase
MGLVKQYLRGELEFYKENQIRIRHTGDVEKLPPEIAEELREACEETSGFEGMQVVLALNYGGRDEILRGVKKLFADTTRETGAELTETAFRHYLDNPDIPDPDLIIRTAGEFRTSNFLLWGGAYAEYWISEKLWPDFTGEDLQTAIAHFQERDRRFGNAKA